MTLKENSSVWTERNVFWTIHLIYLTTKYKFNIVKICNAEICAFDPLKYIFLFNVIIISAVFEIWWKCTDKHLW